MTIVLHFLVFGATKMYFVANKFCILCIRNGTIFIYLFILWLMGNKNYK